MKGTLEIPPGLEGINDAVAAGLERVAARFDAHLASELPAMHELLSHVERYRGKMLRPTLVLTAGIATSRADAAAGGDLASAITDAHIALGAVVEMVHMATLVHDDVLDEADVRRRGQTVNSMSGNETAVILGDYLIAGAYHLCSLVDGELEAAGGQRASSAVGDASMQLCAGELLQLHHRGNWSLDETTYYEIVKRKTASLIAVAATLGATASGAPAEERAALERFGELAGIAFQVQDDLLDLTGDEATVGKSVRKDLAKGKLTLPLLHALAAASPTERGVLLRRIELVSDAGDDEPGKADAAEAEEAVSEIVGRLTVLGSVEHATREATRLVEESKSALLALRPSPARDLLAFAAEASVRRKF